MSTPCLDVRVYVCEPSEALVQGTMLVLYPLVFACCCLVGGMAIKPAITTKSGVPRDGLEDQGPPHPLQHHRVVFTENGSLCAFPFRLRGKLFRTCVPSKQSGKSWCATTPNYDKDNLWEYCEEIKPLAHDYCQDHVCWHGGACVNNPSEQNYTCLCTEPFTGDFCEKQKCFERRHLRYYNIGETWTRVLHGDIERCFCAEDGIHSQLLNSTDCEINLCLNNGMCRKTQATGERVCSCSDGHAGKNCEIDTASRCYKDKGTLYRGKAKRTASGTDCLPWTSSFISMELDMGSLKEPHMLGVGDHPYCRNFDNDEAPWCYTLMNDTVSWDYCMLPRCPVQDPCLSIPCQNGGTCISDALQKSYYCQCSDQYSGVYCQAETCLEKTHHRYFHIRERWNRFVDGKVESCVCAENGSECQSVASKDCEVNLCLHAGECRSIQGTAEAICGCHSNFVGKYCEINKNENCYEDDGVTYKGTEDESESNTECMPWKESFLRNKLNVSSLEEALRLGLGDHSYCRNPDGDKQPWCYVMLDNHISWEYCNIPKCGTPSITPRRFPAVARSLARKLPRRSPTCGVRHLKNFRPRVVGGTTAMRGSHPWIAAIYMGKMICGGTLIAPCWVVTAAHCFLHSPLESSIHVVLGQQDFNKTDKNTQEFEVQKYFLHHAYSIYEENVHDIALIKLKKVSKQCAFKSHYVQPLCLPSENDFFPAGSMCQVTGWGHMKEDASEYAKTLQEASIPIISRQQCASSLYYGSKVTPSMICAGDLDKGIDTCQGDSGGPLVCYRDHVGYLYGVASWGEGCAAENKPGVYTNVPYYVEWIYSIIKRRPKYTKG
ncbi:LOW QUALITY PROTEIN: hepatocyte growth factor activator [Mobula birostris]|uniref:LOW QUALITY PROTEIN: hepatocyte growth factor activator n=1 Tax=Mobula birostris TaxID=1983395 RepID=UPI003B28948C